MLIIPLYFEILARWKNKNSPTILCSSSFWLSSTVSVSKGTSSEFALVDGQNHWMQPRCMGEGLFGKPLFSWKLLFYWNPEVLLEKCFNSKKIAWQFHSQCSTAVTTSCMALYRRENEGLLGAGVFPLHYHNAPKNPYCSCSILLCCWAWSELLEDLASKYSFSLKTL